MPDPESHWRLYEPSVGLVEAQVDRQGSTNQFFVLLNASVLAAAVTLLQVADSAIVDGLLIAVLVGGAGLAGVGLRVLKANKGYYRALVAKKTMIEASLGLAGPIPGFESVALGAFSLGPVATQKKVARILADPDKYANDDIRRWSATDWARWVLLGLLVLDLAGAALVTHHLVACVAPGIPCR
ncbi:MAG: hypothetical protein QOE90_2027 [Thermoplasmata archaeon]|nr:hypothetical protein [Thermoplasmata archaeon]